MRHLKLSTRIRQRMNHCKKCHGTGSYWFIPPKSHRGLYCACADCSDWKIVLRDVRKLERELLCIQRVAYFTHKLGKI